MTLTALERLDLNDQLDELMIKAQTAKGLDLLDLNDQIEEVMLKLGFGSARAAPTDTIPSPVVTEFLAGKFVNQPQMDFVDTLREVGAYLDQFLSLDDMRQQVRTRIAKNNYAM
jgi:hypothetical protein